MRKIIGIFICMLVLLLAMPAVSSTDNSDVEIDLFAGTKHMWIGNGVGFWVRNNGDEFITATITCDMYYFQNSERISLNINVEPNQYETGNFGILGGFKFITVSAQVGDIIHYRSGISIGQFIIFISNSPF
jgi:putative cell wall-binding protein